MPPPRSRVTRICSSGQLTYAYVCTKEIAEPLVVAPFPPRIVKARHVTGLEPGRYVEVIEDLVSVASPTGRAAMPTVVGGVPVT